MGLGPIPASKIKDYATAELSFDGEEAERFAIIIRRMDDEYLSLANAVTKKSKTAANEVSADDTEGVRAMFRTMALTKKPAVKKK